VTEPLFRKDAYSRRADGQVAGITAEGGIVLDQTIFYPTGGGQPGDSGRLTWEGGACDVLTTVKGDGGKIVLVAAENSKLPPPEDKVVQHLDWDRRYSLMRVHTALHLLSVVIPLPVTGGSISEGKGRLDFDMAEPPEDKDALESDLNNLISNNFSVTESWITDEELDASPDLVKTMSVAPPRGSGHVRLVRIGDADTQIDLQPCGGTHVARTVEIGRVRLGKIEKKGARNRRVYLHLD
jgi:misacylated tRNA(Ala) deacylase